MERDAVAPRLGAHIKQARTEAGVSQGALAKALGMEQTSVSQWETGKNLPSVERLRQVEQALDLPPGTLTRELGFIPVPGAETAPPIKSVRRPQAVEDRLDLLEAKLLEVLEALRQRE